VSSHAGERPPIGSYWAYFYTSHLESLDWAMVPRAIVRVDGWNGQLQGKSSVELTIAFTATAAELDPHKVEDLCRLEMELDHMDFPRFWELVDQGLLALIGPCPSRVRHSYQLRFPGW